MVQERAAVNRVVVGSSPTDADCLHKIKVVYVLGKHVVEVRILL